MLFCCFKYQRKKCTDFHLFRGNKIFSRQSVFRIPPEVYHCIAKFLNVVVNHVGNENSLSGDPASSERKMTVLMCIDKQPY